MRQCARTWDNVVRTACFVGAVGGVTCVKSGGYSHPAGPPDLLTLSREVVLFLKFFIADCKFCMGLDVRGLMK